MAAHSMISDLSAIPMSSERSSDRTIYFLWVVFWALMIVIAVQDHLHESSAQWWEPVLWEGSSALLATCWFLLQRYAESRYRRYLDEPWRWFAHHLKWMPLVIATFLLAVYSFRHAVYGALGETYDHEPWTFVVVYESIKLLLFVGLWLGILFGFSSFEQRRQQRHELAVLQKSLAEAELAQLKAQLRPHFLFNALNTISALMHTDVDRADRLLARLSDLLRATLQSTEQERIALRDELRLLELYAQIMQERFADRVTLEWRIEPAALGAFVPALLLQPLLENAFKHGVERSRALVHIVVRVTREDDALLIAVSNTGALHSSAGAGVGVRNTCERLRVMYGDDASLALTQDGADVIACVRLPFDERGP